MASFLLRGCEQIVFSAMDKAGKTWYLKIQNVFKSFLQPKLCVHATGLAPIFRQKTTSLSTSKIALSNLLNDVYSPNPHYLLLELSFKI